MNAMPQKILSWSEYRQAEKNLRDAQEKLDFQTPETSDAEKKEHYQSLENAAEQMITLRDQAFPLLLSNGDPLPLKFPPVSLYLLPPLGDPNRRYLLALFYLNDGQAAAQLIAWDSEKGDDAKQDCILSVLSDNSSKETEEEPQPTFIEGCRHRLDRPPYQIQAIKLGKTGLAQLSFSQGQLEITFDEQRGISHCDWTVKKSSNIDEWIQRSSFANMPAIVHFSRVHNELNWRDDHILDPQNKKPFPLQAPIGHIRGADGFADGQIVYLASNLGKLFRIHGSRLDDSILFGNEILDVLLIGNSQANPQLLIAEKEGFIYLLDKKLKVRHWQNLECHIVRLIGNGSDNLLAVDKSGRLLPLHLYDPDVYKQLREQETLSHRLLKVESKWRFPDIEETRRRLISDPKSLYRLTGIALDYFFRHLHLDKDSVYCASFAVWLRTLDTLCPQLDSAAYAELSEIQRRLLRHALRWIINSCYCQRYQGLWSQTFPDHDGKLHPSLAVIFQLLTLSEQASDELWLMFFRRRDWIDCWARASGLSKQPAFQQALKEIHDHSARYRQQFVPAFNELRPLNIVKSFRLLSPITHMEILQGQNRYLAALTGDRQLSILDLTSAQGQDWLVAKWSASPWQGRPSFVRCLPPNHDRSYSMMVGTLRGELYLLEWHLQDGQFIQKRKWDCDFSICCSHLTEQPESILLLGGRKQNGQACLYRWQADKPTSKPSEVWVDQGDLGSLCMMRHSDKHIWALNRDRGQLLAWDFASPLNSRVPRPQRWLDGVHKLYSLEYLVEQNRLVCGGENGRIWCLSADDGSVQWLVHAPGDLRHVRYRPNYREHKNLCLLTCDDGSNLLVNENGDIICIYERLGTVNALISGKEEGSPHLILATQSGRVVILGDLNTLIATSKKNLPAHSAPYPLRQPTAPLTLPEQPYQEALLNLICLQEIVDWIQKSSINSEKQQIAAFVFHPNHDTLNGLVFFLYRLKSLDIALLPSGNAEFVLELLELSWQEIKTGKRNASAWFCKLLAPIRQILDKFVPQDHRASLLREEINQKIWPELIKPSALVPHRSLRLLLAAKCWHDLPKPAASSLQKLYDWCNQLSEECQARDSEQLSAVIRELVNESLSLLPGEPWWIWLKTLVSNPHQAIDHPEPLKHLLVSQCEALSQDAVTALADLFPDNRAWTNWLDNLQAILTSLQSNRRSILHMAHREQGDWLRLREHLLKGHDNFSIASGQALLALFWPPLCRHWESLIQLGLAELETRVFEQPEAYLDLTCRDLWLSKTQVELRIQIGNRFRGILELHHISWNGSELAIADLPLTLAHRTDGKLKLNLPCQNECLSGELRLACRELESNREVPIPIPVNIPRGVAVLSSEQLWQATWQRLMALLDDFQSRKLSFYWLDGDVWTAAQRQRLKQDVLERFGFNPDGARSSAQLPWFCPDLALNAETHIQLAQLHALLPTLPGTDALSWSLAFWHWAGKLSDGIAGVLANLPDGKQVETVLGKLYAGDQRSTLAIKTALKALPARAFGAWAANQPFYAAAPGESLTVDELYLPPAMLTDDELWCHLEKATDDEVASLLDLTVAGLFAQRKIRLQFRQNFPALLQGQSDYSEACDQLVKYLLRKLGVGTINFEPNNGYWRIRLGTALSLNWQDYSDCRLLPRQSAIKRSKLKIKQNIKPLWLCIGESDAPDLPGTVLTMTERDLLAILHAETVRDVQLWLNQRYAAQQTSISTAEVFRSNGGMGALVAKHFFGKDAQLAELQACLSNTDKPAPGVECREAALLIGGRRMGKTSLRERIQYLMQLDEPDRVCWAFNFESLPEHLHGNELERWFLLRYVGEASAKSAFPFTPEWPDQFKDSAQWRDRSRQQLRDHLQAIKQKNGKTPLWTFDETDWLAKADTQNPRTLWQLFSFFRKLINSGEVCIFATSYPHGAEQTYALNNARLDSSHAEKNPIYNTFTHGIELGPWQPDEAWEFLHSRLSGMGVILPRRYREELLTQTRGVVWAVHELGEELCKALPKNQRLKMVDSAVWQQAMRCSLQRMLNALKTPVDQAGRRQDARYNISAIRLPEASLQHLLWPNLVNLAKPLYFPVCDAERWLEPIQSINLQQLKEAMPKVKEAALVAALNELTASPVLAGDKLDRYTYYFAYNLLPTWKHLDARERENDAV